MILENPDLEWVLDETSLRPDTDGLHSISQGATKSTLAFQASVFSIHKRGCTRLRTSLNVSLALLTPQPTAQ